MRTRWSSLLTEKMGLMGSESGGSSNDKFWGIAFAALLGVIAFAYLLPSLAVALGGWLWVRNRFGRTEYALMVLAAALAWVGGGLLMVTSYTTWWVGLFGGSVNLPGLFAGRSPLIPVLVNSFLLLGVFGLISGTALTKRIPSRFKAHQLEDRDSILPTEKEIEQLGVVARAPGIRKEPIVSTGEVGSRSFQVATGTKAEPVMLSESEIKTHMMLLGSTGSGKALDVHTPIATPTGWSTMGRLSVGDNVFDELGKPCAVTFVTGFQHGRDCYRVEFSDGSHIIADGEHRWVTETADPDLAGAFMAVRSTLDISTSLRSGSGGLNHRIMVASALHTPLNPTMSDPHALGRLAGLDNSALPAQALRAAPAQRLSLLTGVASVLGTRHAQAYSLHVPAGQLADDIVHLVSSLGMIAVSTVNRETDIVLIEFSSDALNPHAAWDDSPVHRYITAVVPVESRPVKCIKVDSPSHLYLAGSELIATHNTETIKVIVSSLLTFGWSGMVLDLKEDAGPGGLRDWCEKYALSHQVAYQELCSSAQVSHTWFNPLEGLGPDEIRDTILALQEFDDAHWANINKEMLGQLVNLMVWANQVDPTRFKPPDMYTMGQIMTQDNLPGATKKMRAAMQHHPGVEPEMFDVLAHPSEATKKSAPGYGAKLKQIFETQAGRTVLRASPDGTRRVIDVTSRGLTYVGLDSLGKADLTKMVSSAVLQRMSAYASARTTGQTGEGRAPAPRFLIVDEAGWVDRTIVTNLLARARSAGICVILCTQGPKDWIDKQGDDWGMLTNNVNVSLIMAQGSPDSAELCAEYIGQQYRQRTSETVKKTKGLLWDKPVRNADGEVTESLSVSEELAYKVEPEELRNMTVGDIIVRVGKPKNRVQWGKVQMRNPTDLPGVWEESIPDS